MTNLERIRNMDEEELISEFQKFRQCDAAEYVDLKEWLESEDREYPVKGQKAKFRKIDGTSIPCMLLNWFSRMGAAYGRILLPGDQLHEFELMSVPAGLVVMTDE